MVRKKKVYLRADARARYGDVKQALIEIRQAGIEMFASLREAPAVGLTPSTMFDGSRD